MDRKTPAHLLSVAGRPVNKHPWSRNTPYLPPRSEGSAAGSKASLRHQETNCCRHWGYLPLPHYRHNYTRHCV